jgi:hypothetical protein
MVKQHAKFKRMRIKQAYAAGPHFVQFRCACSWGCAPRNPQEQKSEKQEMMIEISGLSQPIYFVAGHVFSTPPRVEIWHSRHRKIIALMRNIFDENPILISESELLEIEKFHPELIVI